MAPNQPRRATARSSCRGPDYRGRPARRRVSRARHTQVGVSFLRAPQPGPPLGLVPGRPAVAVTADVVPDRVHPDVLRDPHDRA
ncbi:hypothetical protein C6A85_89390, partial [Mycobacterium sp. ITM-2017-0098]